MKKLALPLLALLSGCTLVDGPDAWTRRSDELAHNRQVWLSLTATSYRFTLVKSCECIAGFVGPVEVTVDNGAIAAVRPLYPGRTVTPDQWGAFETVEGLFSRLDDAVRRRAYRYDARYDAVRGFPAWIALDPNEQMVDDEVSMRVDSLTILR